MSFSLFRKQQAELYRERLQQAAANPENREHVVLALLSAICAGEMNNRRALAKALFPKAPYVDPMEVAPLVWLVDWCKANDVPHRVVDDARTVTVEQTSRYTSWYEYQVEPAVYAALPEARIIPGWDQVLTSNGQVIADTCYNFDWRIKDPKVWAWSADLLLPKADAVLFYAGAAEERIEGDVFFLSVPFMYADGYHFGHWMIDFLPRLRAFDLESTSASWKIAVPEDISAKQIESIVMMGFGIERILKLRRDTRYVCETLHVLKIGRSMPPNPTFVKYLRERLYVGGTQPRPGKRIYLDRGEIGTRLIANAVEFEALLDKFGFQRVDVSKLTLVEQQAFLADAEVLMGSFGSALLSVYFAPPKSVLIDLLGEHREDPTLPHTCFFIGVTHQFLICKLAPPDPAKWWHKNDPDLIVDCAELERRLLSIGR